MWTNFPMGDQATSLHQPTNEPAIVPTEQPILPHILLQYCYTTTVFSVWYPMALGILVGLKLPKNQGLFVNICDSL